VMAGRFDHTLDDLPVISVSAVEAPIRVISAAGNATTRGAVIVSCASACERSKVGRGIAFRLDRVGLVAGWSQVQILDPRPRSQPAPTGCGTRRRRGPPRFRLPRVGGLTRTGRILRRSPQPALTVGAVENAGRSFGPVVVGSEGAASVGGANWSIGCGEPRDDQPLGGVC